MATNSFITQRDQNYIEKTRTLLRELPPFCAEFFRGISSTTTPLSRYGYAMDLRTFFVFLIENTDPFKSKTLANLTLDDLNQLSAEHIEKYMEYLTSYTTAKSGDAKNTVHTNKNPAKSRKLSSLRALCKYYFKKEKLTRNVAALVDAPKLRDKPIIRLEKDEMYALLDVSENGNALSKNQKYFHKHTQKRDQAIISLFLGTGIRISELVGLDLSDFDFKLNGFRITRKGGNQVILYFGTDVASALQDYLLERTEIMPVNNQDDDAFFLSIQKKRITTRAVQNLVKKYSRAAVPLKDISPHKLRSTYGTMLYQETGDIYLVADVLGHRDVNTTKKHYAAQSDENRRLAAKLVNIKKKES